MLKNERQNHILEIIKNRKYCPVNILAKQLFVAPITIRRDLAEMENQGLITRCYGGASIPEHENREVPFDVRNASNHSVKVRLAREAAAYINAGDVVFLDASSTVSNMVDYLSAEQNLTVVTNSMLVTEKLREKHIRCYLTGGMPIENSHALVGSIAEQTISGMYANICFFSAQGISEDGMITDHSELETALRRLMIQNSQKQIFLFDSSKYGKRFAFKLCTTDEIDHVITDQKNGLL